MAVQPIDLQTLFTQLDKVGKDQASQKEGVAIQQSIQSRQMQKRTDEYIQSVNEAQDTGQGAEEINDRNARKGQHEEDTGDGDKKDAAPPAGGKLAVFKDPTLGKNIDFSG
ncbi:hypothetical protein AGMMS50255_9120 [Spirochaetia bacterium]|nr:hypothetical protein AGMMS50255_9120 [Spirochaetia bacterium]